MGVIRVEETTARNMEADEKQLRRYTRTWVAWTNNKDDGPEVVLLDPRMPRKWSLYLGRTGIYDLGARCVKININQDTATPLKWIVSAIWTTEPPDSKGRGEEMGANRETGQPPQGHEQQSPYERDKNPLLRPATWTWGEEIEQRPVIKGYAVDDLGFEELTLTPLQNSLKFPFEPHVMDICHQTLTIRKNQLTYYPNNMALYRMTINSKPFLGFDPGQVKCKSITASSAWENNISYWEVVYVFLFNKDGFRIEKYDAGREGYLLDRDATTGAVTVPYAWGTKVYSFRNRDGSLKDSLTFLDGEGRELPPDDPTYPPVVLRWNYLKGKDFNLLGLV